MGNPRNGNPDLRRAVSVPAPSNEELEARLLCWLTPGTFANLKSVKDKTRQLRDRVLTLPVMVAIVLSLVYRQMSGLSEVLRVLEQEGLMWVEAQSVSKQALSNRLRTLPAELFAQLSLAGDSANAATKARGDGAACVAACAATVWGSVVSGWLDLGSGCQKARLAPSVSIGTRRQDDDDS